MHFTGNWSLAKGKVGVGWLADGIPRSGMRLRVCIVGRGGGTIYETFSRGEGAEEGSKKTLT